MLIPNSITEADKHRILNNLMTDMDSFLKLRAGLCSTGERAEYVAALDKYLKAGLFVIAREFVEHYDLAPIDH